MIRRRLSWLGAFVAVLLALYLGVGALVATRMTWPQRHFHAERSLAAQKLTYQDVAFQARGGDARIAGWYVPHAAGRWALIIVHGKDSSRTEEFSGRFAEFAAKMYQRGFALLSIDLRGHGQSSAGRYSFGYHEHRDVLGAVDWLRQQGYPPRSIGVLGVSMGASTSVLAAAREPAIGALVEDCGYAEIYSILQKGWSHATGLPKLFMAPTRLWVRLLYGYDLAAVRPIDEAPRIAPRPMLIIHGEDDPLIPVSHAHALKQAFPSAELWVLPGVRHARAYNQDPQAYVERVAGFLQRSLTPLPAGR